MIKTFQGIALQGCASTLFTNNLFNKGNKGELALPAYSK